MRRKSRFLASCQLPCCTCTISCLPRAQLPHVMFLDPLSALWLSVPHLLLSHGSSNCILFIEGGAHHLPNVLSPDPRSALRLRMPHLLLSRCRDLCSGCCCQGHIL